MDLFLYIAGIILAIIITIFGIIYWRKRKFHKTIQNFSIRETHISKIFVSSFTIWFIVFAQFTAVVLFIFCLTMLVV
ncbi:hypothetical protein [Spiroplasma alleghenense]|uniref:Uncharacterized protein n=1 Tax=Spiroplasma alleghenense TaxID=216931 RepID=A0A345Z533_9MOLU|nr:hypothetical protein [Spiroplasma alleghenense]AXK51712.1 hypothetical protein SALLE_v1c10420 [Spiroplasma alleghenense]